MKYFCSLEGYSRKLLHNYWKDGLISQ